MVSEFFSSEAIKDAGEALVREAIQNSLDARRNDAEKVVVRVYVADAASALTPTQAARWFDGAWPHYRAEGNGLRPGDVNETTPCKFLAFEDFGTTGLTGDRTQYEERNDSDNPFFYFFRAEAKTAKHGDARGRWGIGKQVFPRSSRAQGFFGYSETADASFLMGGCILKHHWVGDVCYKPDGFWGVPTAVDGDTVTIPVTDPAILERFRKDFRLRRSSGEQGLSVVVPWLDEGERDNHGAGPFNRLALVFAILDGYFIPIIEGRLEAVVEDESGAFHLSKSTYQDVLAQLAGLAANRQDDLARLGAFLRLAEKARDSQCVSYELPAASAMKAAWDDAMLDETVASSMRDALKDGQAVAVGATLTVRRKGDEPVTDRFRCFIEKSDGLTARACHVREDLLISDVRSAKIPGYACLVRIDRGALATLLGDSENPSHTDWQATSRNFKDRYVYGGLTIDFVSNFAAEVLKRVHASSRELDRTLLLDLFADLGPDIAPETKKKKQPDETKEVETPPVLPAPEPARYRIDQIETGFSISSAADRLPPGTELTIKAAYETVKGNPFKAYDPNDFRLTDRDMLVEVSGADILLKEANELKVRVSGEALEVRVSGFDVNRDVQVKVAAQIPVIESDAAVATA